ncbi:MAG: ABC transporter substrate-binding protein [Gammaproteobacteria bacterium]|nr:ABC transporter substrate-binding protein [Gammaproteobacteria bacterium]
MLLSRRGFMLPLATSLITTFFSGLAFSSADPLLSMVDDGKLPPLVERLPTNPLVIEPTSEVGTHGGTWNHALVGGGSLVMLVRYQGYEPQVRFNPEWTGVEFNVAENVEVNSDATQYKFKLREGMKWSDGEPYTTEDVRFWYEDMFQNEEVAATRAQSYWSSGGEVAQLEVVDDYNFTVSFKAPNGFFLQNMARGSQDSTTRAPAHYLKQFHIQYNENANELAKEQGLDNWVALFHRESGIMEENVYYQNSSRPTLEAWKFTTAPGEDTERAIAERNPYYFKVDTEGQQLPYFDRIVYQMVGDNEVLLLKTLQGEIDFMGLYINTPANKPVLFDSKETGNYDFFKLKETAANAMVFMLNLNHTDPVKNELFNTRDFRVALSHAIDRQAMIDAVFVGQGKPAQPSVLEGDPLHNPTLSYQYTEYDPDKANEILDGIIPDKDAEGFRLDKNGNRLTIVFEIDQARATFLDMFELALPNFKAVGIDAQMRTMDRSLWETRVRGGREFDASAHRFGANNSIGAMLDPRYFVPYSRNGFYASGWSLYFSSPDNENAIEPPAPIKAQQERYKKLLTTANPDDQVAIMKEILDEAAKQFLVFGVTLPPDSYGIVKNDLKNTMPVMTNSFAWPTPGPSRPEQFFKN